MFTGTLKITVAPLLASSGFVRLGLVALAIALAALPAGMRKTQQAPAQEPGVSLCKPRVRLGTLRFRHRDRVTGLAVPADSKILASCGLDGEVRLWDIESGDLLRRLSGNGEPLLSVAIPRDGRWVAAGDDKGMLYLWEAGSGKEVQRWKSGCTYIHPLAFAPDGQSLASVGAGESKISLWTVPGATELWSLRAETTGPLFSPDGKTLATCLRKGSPAGAVLPDGFVTLLDPGFILLLDAATGQQRARLPQQIYVDRCLAFSPDGKTLASCGGDGPLRLWDVASGRQLHTLKGNWDAVCHVAFTQDGQTLALVSNTEGRLDSRLWDLATRKERRRFPIGAGEDLVAVVFSGDGKILFTAGDDHAIRRWDTDTGEEIQGEDGQGAVTAVAIAPDGKPR